MDEVVWEKLKKKLEIVGQAVDGEGGVLSASAVEAETSPTEVQKDSLLSEIMQSIGDMTNRKRKRDFKEDPGEETPKKRGPRQKREVPKVASDDPSVSVTLYQPKPKPNTNFIGQGPSSRRSVTSHSAFVEDEREEEVIILEPETLPSVPALPPGGDGRSKLDCFTFPKSR